MSKLKNIIKQLSDKDSQEIYNSLINSNAEKSAYLLKFMREKQFSDSKIMEELEVNHNAYYTLRSRLNQKIEEYLLLQIENPRTDILKKVASIQEIFFTKKKAIIVASLKKLEKELINYDISSELTIVYKYLKRLHAYSPEKYYYSQLYNKHVAYMLALDKAEDLLADYFRTLESFFIQGKHYKNIQLGFLCNEINNVCNLYHSHRLYVYQSAVNIYHRLFIDEDHNKEIESIEDIFDKVNTILDTYGQDTTYYHLHTVFEFLRYEYSQQKQLHEQAEKHYNEVNDYASALLTNYGFYTFSPRFLFSKIERNRGLNALSDLYEENKVLFLDYENDVHDIGRTLIYMTYRAVVCFFVDKYEEAAKWLNNLLNELSLKKYPVALLDVKILLALQYCLIRDEELYNQLVSSIQRQVRILGKDECGHITLLIKMMKVSMKETGKSRYSKISALVEQLKKIEPEGFSVLKMIKPDERFVQQLCAVQ
jgi:hypothetical protein